VSTLGTKELGILAICMLGIVSPVKGQSGCSDPVCLKVEVPRSLSSQLTTHVTVTNSEGRPYPGLTKENLRVTVDGTVTEISEMYTRFSDSTRLGVVIVIDRSESIGKDHVSGMQEAVQQLTAPLAPYDQVGIVSTMSDTIQAMDFSTSRDSIERWSSSIQLGGNTALRDAIIHGANMLQDVHVTRKALIVISDGEDTRSSATPETVRDVLRPTNWPFFVLGTGDETASERLRRWASMTNGEYFEGADQALMLYSQLVAPLQGLEYVITFPFRRDRANPTHKLVVETRYDSTTYSGMVLFEDKILSGKP